RRVSRRKLAARARTRLACKRSCASSSMADPSRTRTRVRVGSAGMASGALERGAGSGAMMSCPLRCSVTLGHRAVAEPVGHVVGGGVVGRNFQVGDRVAQVVDGEA